ncbi:hypothetical protein FN846DRAFT_319666 [Sphaerosporella brunnea]|uniref:Uncharacterized protein n=1 Tax=Sphaerosporella brunnea TaxID=1250544 RepID=A0A5J5EJ57_9PEZI|nr:hypothetical protein FN846DRAFT_319666 [Sphaerosporella brunnea]
MKGSSIYWVGVVFTVNGAAREKLELWGRGDRTTIELMDTTRECGNLVCVQPIHQQLVFDIYVHFHAPCMMCRTSTSLIDALSSKYPSVSHGLRLHHDAGTPFGQILHRYSWQAFRTKKCGRARDFLDLVIYTSTVLLRVSFSHLQFLVLNAGHEYKPLSSPSKSKGRGLSDTEDPDNAVTRASWAQNSLRIYRQPFPDVEKGGGVYDLDLESPIE